MKTKRIPGAVPFVQTGVAAVCARLRPPLAVVLILATLLTASCSTEPDGPFFRVADRSYSSVSGAVFDAISSQVFLVGEHHDNPLHHRTQLEIIREIHEKAEKPLAIGLEMFETGYQAELDRWIAGNLGLDDFLKTYYRNWDFPWVLYRDIFLYAREHQIPLVALNIPREVTRKVARQGFASLGPEELALLPSGVTCDVTPDYETFIQRVFEWHGKKDNSFSNFCEAQVLWDAIMAANLLQYHEQAPSMKLVVLAGGGHAWKPGIPRQITMRKDLEITVFLPETHQLQRKNVSARDTDYLRLFNPDRQHRG
ncbi:MAG: ChaN family lipoprotein [Deltaproteobacteria bacterium]|jgi:uncharacterized iron-regulated protein|nr:ChaN family lipoprotein [Deltaproteobacteria bacterium]